MIQLLKPTRLLTLAGAALLALALLAPAAQAAEPAEGYEQFSDCPSPEEAPSVYFCQRVDVTGGHFQMGSKTVPIEKPLSLSGGLTDDGDFVDATLEPVKQKVPGGVVGLTGLTELLEQFGSEELTLYATTELAGLPGNAFVEPLFLPIKVHLTNPAGLVGGTCYIGSNADPINLNLIVGTTDPPPPNEPISGTEPEFSFDGELGIFHLDNGTFVDNSFAAPGANGCKLTLLGLPISNIDALVNLQAGLPSEAGTNETVQDFDLEFTETTNVYP